jgi:hypothetical protein
MGSLFWWTFPSVPGKEYEGVWMIVMLFKQITGVYADGYQPGILPKSITIAKNWDVCPRSL